MKKEKKPNKENKEKKSLQGFLKKRAPVYLAIIALLIVFVVPELTKGTLQDHIPDDLTDKEKEVLDVLLSYRGPNDVGLSIEDVLAEKIEERYPNEKIFDHKDTVIDVIISEESDIYEVNFILETKKDKLEYVWNVNTVTGEVLPKNPEAKNISGIVEYSD